MISKNKWSMGLLCDSIPYANLEKDSEAVVLKKLNLKDIIQVDFPNDQYIRKQTDKKQIILHHTVSGQGVEGDIAWWRKTSQRIGTQIIIDWEGKMYQCYSSKYWGYHLGTGNSNLDKHSIGIEIDSWGGLVKHNKQWYPAKWDDRTKKYIANISHKPINNVQKYPDGFRGFYGYEKYTKKQIEAVGKLLVYWNEIYNIPLNYNSTMFDVSKEALMGKPGIWSHVSFRKDKSDCHPQPDLINMLKSLI